MAWRKDIGGIAAAFAIFIIILDSRTAFLGAAQGIDLCLRTVIPSLFPLLYLSNRMITAFAGESITVLRLAARIFHFPKKGEALLIPALLGGYPVGAQSIATAWNQGLLDKKAAENMLAYGSNIGPAFLFGILSFQFSHKQTLWQLWCIQLLSVWTASCVFGSRNTQSMKNNPAKKSVRPLDAALRASAQICGWIVLFRVLIAFLDRWIFGMLPELLRTALIGLLELSNGCMLLNTVTDEGIRFILASALLAFGGISVLLQTITVCGNLRIYNYLFGKILQSAVAALLAWLFRCHLWFAVLLWVTGMAAFSNSRFHGIRSHTPDDSNLKLVYKT